MDSLKLLNEVESKEIAKLFKVDSIAVFPIPIKRRKYQHV